MSSVVILIWYGVMAVVAYISSCGQCVLSCESGFVCVDLVQVSEDGWAEI